MNLLPRSNSICPDPVNSYKESSDDDKDDWREEVLPLPLGAVLAEIEMQQAALARAVPIAVGVAVVIAGKRLAMNAYPTRIARIRVFLTSRGLNLPLRLLRAHSSLIRKPDESTSAVRGFGICRGCGSAPGAKPRSVGGVALSIAWRSNESIGRRGRETACGECRRRLRQCAGYAVDVADDGESGVFMAENNEYDLGILDLTLPKLVARSKALVRRGKREATAKCVPKRQKKDMRRGCVVVVAFLLAMDRWAGEPWKQKSYHKRSGMSRTCATF